MAQNSNDIEVVIWDDPVWAPALEALDDQGNAKPLAELLSRGLVPPQEVSVLLGKMLAPPPGYVGRSLTVKTPKRDITDFVRKLVEDFKLGNKIRALSKTGVKLEAAVAKVREETGLSRAKLFDAYGLNTREIVRRSQVMLGNAPRLPNKNSLPKNTKSPGL